MFIKHKSKSIWRLQLQSRAFSSSSGVPDALGWRRLLFMKKAEVFLQHAPLGLLWTPTASLHISKRKMSNLAPITQSTARIIGTLHRPAGCLTGSFASLPEMAGVPARIARCLYTWPRAIGFCLNYCISDNHLFIQQANGSFNYPQCFSTMLNPKPLPPLIPPAYTCSP